MSVLVYDHFKELEETRVVSAWMGDAVREGLWPWQASDIEVFLEFDIDFNRQRLIVIARPYSRTWRLDATTFVDRDDMLDGGREWLAKGCRDIFNAFRYRETLPVPSNIKLGEE